MKSFHCENNSFRFFNRFSDIYRDNSGNGYAMKIFNFGNEYDG